MSISLLALLWPANRQSGHQRMSIFHFFRCLTLPRAMWTTSAIWTGLALLIARCSTSLRKCCRKPNLALLLRCHAFMKRFAVRLSGGPVADYGGGFSIGQCGSAKNIKTKLREEKRPMILSGNWPINWYFPKYAKDSAVAAELISLAARPWARTWQSGSARWESPSWKAMG